MNGTGWAWFALILAASTVFWRSFPDGGVPKLFFVYVLAALASVQLARCRKFDKLDWLIAATVLYVGVSPLWAVDPQGSMAAALHWLAFGLIILAARRLPNEWPILAACLGSAAIILVAHSFVPTYFGGFGGENFETWWFVAAFPIFCAAFMEWPALASPVILISAIYILFFNDAHVEIAPISAWLLIIALRAGKWGKWIAAVGVLIGAGLLIGLSPASVSYRLDLWAAAVEIWLSAPILGVGPGGFDTLYEAFASKATVTDSAVMVAGAAHSDALQLYSDLGLVGAALVALTLWTALYERDGPMWPVFVVAGLFALAFIDFPLQHPAVALLGAIALGRCKPIPAGAPQSNIALVGTLALAVPLAAILLLAAGTIVQAQKYFALIPVALKQNQPIAAHIFNERSLAIWPYSKRARRELLRTALASGADDAAVKRGISAAESAYRDNRQINQLIALYRKEK